jgi:hypothetical protein
MFTLHPRWSIDVCATARAWAINAPALKEIIGVRMQGSLYILQARGDLTRMLYASRNMFRVQLVLVHEL